MTDPSAVTRALGSPRMLAAWALVGYTALHLFFTFLLWVVPGGTISGRSLGAHEGFTSLTIMAFPVVAAVLAAYVTPAIAGARLVALAALAEYVVALLLGTLTFLIGLGDEFSGLNHASEAIGAFAYLVLGIANLVLILVAAYVVLRAFTGLGGSLRMGRTTP
jgi:hypothetical protein